MKTELDRSEESYRWVQKQVREHLRRVAREFKDAWEALVELEVEAVLQKAQISIMKGGAVRS